MLMPGGGWPWTGDLHKADYLRYLTSGTGVKPAIFQTPEGTIDLSRYAQETVVRVTSAGWLRNMLARDKRGSQSGRRKDALDPYATLRGTYEMASVQDHMRPHACSRVHV